MDDRVAALEKRLGLRLVDKQAAAAALTHRSYVNEHREAPIEDNERLEFLGDAVIDLAVSQRLMERFPLAREGTLSKLRASIVNEQGLCDVATGMGLGELLLLGKGEEMTGGRTKPSVLADAFEAVVAAIFVGSGLPAVLELVDRFFGPIFDGISPEGDDRDFKTQFQELAQGRLRATPRYRVLDESGPDHAKIFTVEVAVDGKVMGRGEGRSKKDAEQLAARMGLDALGEDSRPEG